MKYSGLLIKDYLASVGVAYSTYSYWRKKIEMESHSLPIALISIKHTPSLESALPSAASGVEARRVMLAFPNGVRTHFGAGRESVIWKCLTEA